MSIFFAISGRIDTNRIKLVENAISDFEKYEEENLYILGKGLAPLFNCNFGNNGYIFCGLPISNINNNYKLIESEELASKVTEIDKFRTEVSGHYTVINWDNDNIQIYNDLLGIRQFYHFNHKSSHIFSSSLELIIKYSGIKEIDYFNLSSRIYLNNQLDQSSIFDKIDRYGAGSFAVINRNNNTLQIKRNSFVLSLTKNTPNEFHSLNESALNLEFKNKNIAVALSGGIDSRYLLAIALKMNKTPDLFSFGNPNHPDNIISKKIAKKIGFNYTNLNFSENYDSISYKMINDYSLKNQMQNSLSEIIQKSHIKSIADNNYFLLDGGIGEFGRRGYFNLASLIGFRYFKNKNTQEIIDSFFFKKSISFFNNDFQNQIKSNTNHKLKILIDSMPDLDNIEFDNWLDLFGIRIKYPNFVHYEQTISDDNLINYCPFNFTHTLQSGIAIPVKDRTDAKAYKNYIRNNAKVLSKFPLIKHNFYYPFGFNQTLGKFWLRFAKILKMTYKDEETKNFYQSKKELFLDIISTIKASEKNILNQNKINSLIDEYSKNDFNHLNELDALITFSTYKFALQNL